MRVAGILVVIKAYLSRTTGTAAMMVGLRTRRSPFCPCLIEVDVSEMVCGELKAILTPLTRQPISAQSSRTWAAGR